VSGFSKQWLELREPADHRARCGFDDYLQSPSRGRWHIIDLGCGSGSNFRYLSPRLPGIQEWVCLDHDEALLEAFVKQTAVNQRIPLRTVHAELAKDIDVTLEQARSNAAPDATLLITASALLDLVSSSWLDALIDTCIRMRACALFALTYDGRMSLEPEHSEDSKVRKLIDDHQHSDKGFGAALGPDATRYARKAFESRGYRVRETASDWQLGADQSALQRELLAGWFAAASEQSGDPNALRAWFDDRVTRIESRQLRTTVGHRDLLATLP
jgi:SAM-dependent methyltransferase